MNSVNIDKILDEARSRKPVMQLQEIEQLLQHKTPNRKLSGYWRNLSVIFLTLMLGASVTVYFVNKETGKSAEKLTLKLSPLATEQMPADDANNIIIEQQKPGQEISNYNTNSANNTAEKNQVQHKIKSENSVLDSDKKPREIVQPQSPNTNHNMKSPGFIPAEKIATKFSLKGWDLVSKVPSQFGYGLDKEVVHHGNASAYINSRKSNYNSAWLTQEISAAPYAGKRLKMSAMVKSENAGKKAWAGIFMNIKGNDFKKAGYDNLYEKNVSGQSDWIACEIVMDVPANSKKITFGLYKVYGGNAWIDNIHFETVNTDVPLRFKTHTEAHDTSLIQPNLSSQLTNIIVEKPANLDFEQFKANDLPEGWHIGEEKQHFQVVNDDKIYRSGKSSVFLQSSGYVEKDWNTLMQFCRAGDFAGKRIKLTAWVRTENLKAYAKFILRADGFIPKPNIEKIKEVNFTGNNNWRKVELVLDVPEDATHFSYGILLEGKGKIWMDDITINTLPAETITSSKNTYQLPVNLDFEE